MTSSTQLALICAFVTSILANNIPAFGAANDRLGSSEAFSGLNFDSFHNFDSIGDIAAKWPGIGAAGGAGGASAAKRFVRRDSGISQNNPLVTLAQKISSTPQFNGDLGNNGESINKAGGVGSGSKLARRQGGSGISQNNPVVDTTQQFLNHPFINGALGKNGQSINEAGGVASSGSTLARRQNEHITITETDTETIRDREVRPVAERVVVEEPIHRPLVVEEPIRQPIIVEELAEHRPFGVLSEEFELERAEDRLIRQELAEEAVLGTEFDLGARRGSGAHVLGDEFGFPVGHVGHLPSEENNLFTNHINTVNNFTPNGIAITGVGPNGNGLGRGVVGPVGINNMSVN